MTRIREERSKQTIKEAVDAILKVNREAKDKRSKKVEKYVKRLFEDVAAENMASEHNDPDKNYFKVIVNMKSLLSVLRGHSQAIDSLERKLSDISAPKKKVKAGGRNVKQRNDANMLTHQSQMLRSNNNAITKYNIDNLDEDEMGLDDEGMQDFIEPETPPEH